MTESKFTGKLLPFAWVTLVYWASVLLTANIAMPFGLAYRQRYIAKHTYINGKQLEFFGSGTKLFVKKLAVAIISPILLSTATTLFLTRGNVGDANSFHEHLMLGLSILALVAYALFTVWIILRLKRWVIKHTRFNA